MVIKIGRTGHGVADWRLNGCAMWLCLAIVAYRATVAGQKKIVFFNQASCFFTRVSALSHLESHDLIAYTWSNKVQFKVARAAHRARLFTDLKIIWNGHELWFRFNWRFFLLLLFVV
jgi:hypothetical protein